MIEDRFAQIYKDHYYIKKRNAGASRVLRGNVVIIVFYINDAVSRWTEQDINRYARTHNSAMNILMSLANQNGVNLSIKTASCQLNVSCNCTKDNTAAWIKEAMAGYQKSSASEYQAYFEQKYGFEEAPIMFAFNKSFRSYAQSADTQFPLADEYSAVSFDDNERTIVHELLHQFGANDFYYPEYVKDVANKYLPESVMNIGSKIVIDPLTMYNIGWKSYINDNAALFLQLTAHYTYQDIYNAIIKEWSRT